MVLRAFVSATRSDTVENSAGRCGAGGMMSSTWISYLQWHIGAAQSARHQEQHDAQMTMIWIARRSLGGH